MKFIFKIIKRVIISSFLLYLFNYFFGTYHILIPINLYTVSFVSFFGWIGLVGLILFKCLLL